MKRNMKVVQISGFRGILMVIFIASCLAAGFIAFPAFAAMYAWNFLSEYISIPTINLLQGLMLWAITAISIFIINDRKKYLVAFTPKTQLSEEEMKKVLEQMKIQRAQVINSMILKSNETLDKEKEKEKENL